MIWREIQQHAYLGLERIEVGELEGAEFNHHPVGLAFGESALGQWTTDISDGFRIDPGRGQQVGRQLRRRRLSVRAGDGDHPAGQTSVCQFDLGDRPDSGGGNRLANLGERTDPGTRDDEIRPEDPLQVVTSCFGRDTPGLQPLRRRDLSRSGSQVARIHFCPTDPRQHCGSAARNTETDDRNPVSRREGRFAFHQRTFIVARAASAKMMATI